MSTHFTARIVYNYQTIHLSAQESIYDDISSWELPASFRSTVSILLRSASQRFATAQEAVIRTWSHQFVMQTAERERPDARILTPEYITQLYYLVERTQSAVHEVIKYPCTTRHLKQSKKSTITQKIIHNVDKMKHAKQGNTVRTEAEASSNLGSTRLMIWVTFSLLTTDKCRYQVLNTWNSQLAYIAQVLIKNN